VHSFKSIRARAAERKGGEKALAKLLPAPTDQTALARLADDRVLSCMARCVFSSGFSWKVIEAKWPGFEEAFLGFAPKRLLFEPGEFWDRLTQDARIVRHGAKIRSVEANARFVQEIADEHGSFGKFLGRWPVSDHAGLVTLLAKRGSRLGGNTGQYFLRFIGKDGFVMSKDVVACVRDAGVEVAPEPKSKKDLEKIQAAFNAWAKESGLPYAQISRICALSIGENRSGEEDDGM
jgi:3-methyladenine DNA glycosylase Tag